MACILGRKEKQEKFLIFDGHPFGQEHAKDAIEAHETIISKIKKLLKKFRIYRWNLDHPNNKPYYRWNHDGETPY